jgi:GPH family glycoside/pentoside/hexuronide:cation symporter
LRESIVTTFRNRHFTAFLPSLVFFQAGIGVMIAALPYYVNGIVGRDDEGTWVAILTSMTILAMFVTLPIFARLARRTSKQHAYRTAMLAAAAAFPLFLVTGWLPGIPVEGQAMLVMALAGAPLAGVYLFPGPLLADICDADAANSGHRREGMFFGTQQFAEKAVGAISPLVLALLLMLGSSRDNPLGIRLVGPAGALLVITGYALFRAYTLPDDPNPISITSEPAPEPELLSTS